MTERQLPWSPFGDFERMRQELNYFFGGIPALPWSNLGAGMWQPSVDIYQTENEVVVAVEMPGINPEDVDLTVLKDKLTVKGEVNHKQEVSEEGYYRTERRRGKFQRSLSLPAEVKPEETKASFQNGVLEVRMPKVTQQQNQGYRPKIQH